MRADFRIYLFPWRLFVFRNERLGIREDGEAEVGGVGGKPDAAGKAVVRLMPVAQIVVREGESHLARLAGRDENLLETLQFAKRANQVSGELADIELRSLVSIIGAGIRNVRFDDVQCTICRCFVIDDGVHDRFSVLEGSIAQSER